MRIRPLAPSDLPAASALLAREGWAFPPSDLERLLRIGTAVAAEEDGALVGATFVALYGELAWIGNVVVAETGRGQGVGERLVRAALDGARAAGATTVRLHSVHRAESLYERLAFVREGLVHALRAEVTRAVPRPSMAGLTPLDDAAQVAEVDRSAFGADRTRLLRLLLDDPANRGVLLRDGAGVRGYAILKTSDVVSEIGPAVVRVGDADAAGVLLDACLAAAPAGPLELAVPGANAAALRAARDRGFVEGFTARTMRWGEDARGGEPAAILAAGGLEKG